MPTTILQGILGEAKQWRAEAHLHGLTGVYGAHLHPTLWWVTLYWGLNSAPVGVFTQQKLVKAKIGMPPTKPVQHESAHNWIEVFSSLSPTPAAGASSYTTEKRKVQSKYLCMSSTSCWQVVICWEGGSIMLWVCWAVWIASDGGVNLKRNGKHDLFNGWLQF